MLKVKLRSSSRNKNKNGDGCIDISETSSVQSPTTHMTQQDRMKIYREKIKQENPQRYANDLKANALRCRAYRKGLSKSRKRKATKTFKRAG